jgi:prepilin-type N-terminal cleavage/methylation domain-containing protein
MNRGFSLVEILIAMAVMSIVVSGVVIGSGGFGLTLSGSQSTILGGETNAEAVRKAQELTEESQALGRSDFNLVNAHTTTDGIYTKTVSVETLSDYLTKKVTTLIEWIGDHGQALSTTLTTFVTNLENINSPDTCNSSLSEGWDNAQISSPIDVDNASNNASGNPVTDIKVFDKKLYIVTNNLHGHNEDFYVYDTSVDPQNPKYVSAREINGVTAGFNSVTVSSTAIGKYAYLGNAHDPNFKTCMQSASCSQVEIIDIENPADPVLKYSFKLAENTAPYVWGNGGSGQATGKSVFYKDDYLYLGLSTTVNGPGFHIIDVSNPLAPSWVSSWPTATPTFGTSGGPINAIFVRGDYAYLAHPDGLTGSPSEQVTVLDVSNPASPVRVSGFFYNDSIGGNGKSLSVVGDTLYLGRTASNISGSPDTIPEFFILDNSDPTSIPSTVVGSATLATAESVAGLAIRNYLAFLTTSGYFQIWNIANKALPVLQQSFDLGSIVGSGSTGNASDCEGDNIYIGSYRSNNDKGVILVAYPGTPAPPVFDYSLSASPANLAFTKTTPGVETITVTKIGSADAEEVTVVLSGLPAAVSATPSSAACTPTGGTCDVTFTLSIPNSSHRTGTVTAEGTSPSHTTTFDVVAN